ncbi:MAG: ATP-binding cassette domain-containing protein, partial [Oceanicoccus sp.]|uniref:ATP-binding cassette domain-containing protein n=1 Tax=Oceanicoccus sp. TaxID=2691044 RepID=UPI002613E387
RADHIGFVFQMFNLIPYLSLIENVVLPCQFSKKRRERALERTETIADEARRLMSDLQLDAASFGAREVTKLSVGQQQRVAVARALIGRPELVICDEPTSSLDTDARQSFLELLFTEIEEAEATLILVSHDRSLAGLFDRVIDLSSLNQAGKEVQL